MTSEYPKIDSLWKNDRNGITYKAWGTALDDTGLVFVIYQVNDINRSEQKEIIVRHSEEYMKGVANMRQDENSSTQWQIEWNDPYVTGKNFEQWYHWFDAWAQPLDLWHKKLSLFAI